MSDPPLPVEAALPDELHDDDGVGAVVGDAPDLDDVVVGEPLHEPHLPLHVVHRALGQRVRVLDHLHRHLHTHCFSCGQIHYAGTERCGWGGEGGQCGKKNVLHCEQCCGSRIRLFGIRIKEFKYFNPQKIVSKL